MCCCSIPSLLVTLSSLLWRLSEKENKNYWWTSNNMVIGLGVMHKHQARLVRRFPYTLDQPTYSRCFIHVYYRKTICIQYALNQQINTVLPFNDQDRLLYTFCRLYKEARWFSIMMLSSNAELSQSDSTRILLSFPKCLWRGCPAAGQILET